ncbi:MAG: hypothetical protein ACI4LN_05030 [Anaerovoracaceae bacterium]
MPRKKVIVSVLICLLVVMAAVPVYAVSRNEESANPWALYYSYADAGLSISANGTATVDGKIVGFAGTTTKTTVHLYLQQYKNGDWEDVDDWILSNNSASTSIEKSKSVEKGYKYRAKASCYAYSGTKCEHVTKYSPEVSY